MRKKYNSLSHHDAIEIAAMFTGEKGQVARIAEIYDVCVETVYRVLNGKFFEVLADRELKSVRDTAAMPVE